MNNRTKSIAFHGSQPATLTIECCISRGYSGIQGIGFHQDTSKSIREKIATILDQLGISTSNKKVLCSTSPNHAGSDCNIELAVIVSLYLLLADLDQPPRLENHFFGGELGLDGSIYGIKSPIPFVLECLSQKAEAIILPLANQEQVELVRSLNPKFSKTEIFYFSHLKDLLSWLQGSTYHAIELSPTQAPPPINKVNFDDMQLTEELKTIVCAMVLGEHHLFLSGTPGTGKSMLAQRIPSLLPKLSADDHTRLMQNWSFVNNDKIPTAIMTGEAPFRSPHHLSSAHAILGTPENPGDLSLAHGGLLFLDELPEFRRDLLESLREPLETGRVEVSRAHRKHRWHCRVQLVSAANNCPCGWLGSKRRLCTCPQQKIDAYRRKLSGPLMDRIDIHYQIPEPSPKEINAQFFGTYPGQTKEMKRKIDEARAWRQERLERQEEGRGVIDKLDLSERDAIIHRLQEKMPTRRSQKKTLSLARTLADLDLSLFITLKHLDMALKWQRGH